MNEDWEEEEEGKGMRRREEEERKRRTEQKKEEDWGRRGRGIDWEENDCKEEKSRKRRV